MTDVKELIKSLISEVRTIENLLEETMKPLEETSNILPGASGSLEDVIKYTEQAVHQIMDLLEQTSQNCQTISENLNYLINLNPTSSILKRLELIKEKNDDNLSKILNIMSLMSFQDISSQQIRKVIQVIEDVKKTILKMIISSVDKTVSSQEEKQKIVSKATEMLTGDRIFQEDVDALLKELGL